MVTKFYIHAGVRWCELDVENGQVSGWRERTKFVYLRRGKLHLARTSTVLKGLRELVAGRPSCVHNGLPLSQLKVEKKIKKIKKRKFSIQKCCHTCRCSASDRSSEKYRHKIKTINSSPQKLTVHVTDAAVQVKSPFTSPDDNLPPANKLTTNIHKPPSSKLLKSKQNQTKSRKRSISFTDAETNTNRILTRKEIEKKLHDDVSDSDIEGLRPKKRKRDDDATQNAAKKAKDASESDDDDIFLEFTIEEDVVLALRYILERGDFLPDVDLYLYDTDENYRREVFLKVTPYVKIERLKGIRDYLQRHRESGCSQEIPLKDFAKTLGLTSKDDIQVQQRYKIRKHVRTPVSKQSDSDDSEVIVKKSSKGATAKKGDKVRRSVSKDSISDSSEVIVTKSSKSSNTEAPKSAINSCRVVVETLSISSDSEFETVTRKRIRQLKIRESIDNIMHTIKKEKVSNLSMVKDKESVSNNSESSGRVLRNVSNLEREKERAFSGPQKRKIDDISESGSDFSRKKKSSVKNTFVAKRKKVVNRPTLGLTREYSLLEDHAIVSWVSQGSRASKVNGNALWKQLEECFGNLSGQTRSWHSLRNRYLRHLLPTLGSLALPQSQVSKLRAQAARGCIKSRNSRRASILAPRPVRSAFSSQLRRRVQTGATPADGNAGKQSSSDEDDSPPRRRSLRTAPSVPSYSEITKRFAEKHTHSTDSNTSEANTSWNNKITNTASPEKAEQAPISTRLTRTSLQNNQKTNSSRDKNIRTSSRDSENTSLRDRTRASLRDRHTRTSSQHAENTSLLDRRASLRDKQTRTSSSSLDTENTSLRDRTRASLRDKNTRTSSRDSQDTSLRDKQSGRFLRDKKSGRFLSDKQVSVNLSESKTSKYDDAEMTDASTTSQDTGSSLRENRENSVEKKRSKKSSQRTAEKPSRASLRSSEKKGAEGTSSPDKSSRINNSTQGKARLHDKIYTLDEKPTSSRYLRTSRHSFERLKMRVMRINSVDEDSREKTNRPRTRKLFNPKEGIL